MTTRKSIIFILWAFLPMICIGVLLKYSGLSMTQVSSDPVGAIIAFVLTAGAMMLPLIAVIFTQLIFKEPVLRDVGISFKINRWWFIGWLMMPVVALAVLGMSLLMPGAYWNAESETVKTALQQMPEGAGLWSLIAITIISGLTAGASINAVFAFGEEIGWRGFLLKEFKGKKFLPVALLTGTIWGLWHFPLILNGHNYPQHPVIGVFMMVAMCIALTPMLMYFRQKSGSVIVPAIMHGTFNAIVGISNIFVAPANDLLIGGPGLAGIIILLLADTVIFLYDRYISKELIFDFTIS